MNQAILNRARADKFQLILDVPKFMKGIADITLQDYYSADKIQFSCYGSPVPSINVPSIDVPFGGQVYKTPSNSRPTYPPLVVTFMIDNGWKNYYTLCKWINLFNDQQTSESAYNFKNNAEVLDRVADRNKIPLKDLVSRFRTYALDEYNNRIMSFEYTHVFPTSLSEISFSHQDPSEIQCKVSFAYFQFYPELIKNVDGATC
jgi:hypothetical protein